MQNRLDNAELRMPGYRDRIVHISLADHEGGMNLTMPEPVIQVLAQRGAFAGQRLVERFATPAGDDTPLSWDNHRWVRYRSMMALVERLLSQIRLGYSST